VPPAYKAGNQKENAKLALGEFSPDHGTVYSGLTVLKSPQRFHKGSVSPF
jgi:hypothetical protein